MQEELPNVYYAPMIKLMMVKEDDYRYDEYLDTPAKVAKFAQPLFAGKDREYIYVVHLDSKCEAIAVENVAIGSLNRALIDPRDIYKSAVVNNASRIILLHNHPSGSTTPSRDDIVVTKRLQEAGKLIGIHLVDHVIIGDGYYSFKEEGMLDE